LPVRIETGLYRIAQEALNNIARHAQAGRVNVQIITSAEQAALVIQDDGLGFDPTQVPPGRFGLVGLSERAKLLGGALELQSEPGQGTRLEVRIPLE
jgi:two-component system NarL family sensor kinase